MQLKEKENVGRWKVNKSYENEIRIELYDECHIMPKYTVVIDSVLEFSVFVFQWPIPDDHSIYGYTEKKLFCESYTRHR